jgi:hypothetical protein
MRNLLWIAVLVGFTQLPTAHAQSQGATAKGAHAASSSGSTQGHSQSTSENCGTPDEPKACPPLPRHPLQYYPGDRPSKS